MNHATRTTVAVVGALVGLIGIEHGVGALMQGSTAPESIVIQSWPDVAAFRILGGEPAMTLIPNLLVTGVLAIFFSLLYLLWATLFAQRRYGGLVLILLSCIMLLVGGGFGPPLFGVIVGLIALKIHAPLTWWRKRCPEGLRRFLGALWPWALALCLTVWLAMFPGTVLLSYFFGVENENLVYILFPAMVGVLGLTVAAAFARDAEEHGAVQQSRGGLRPLVG